MRNKEGQWRKTTLITISEKTANVRKDRVSERWEQSKVVNVCMGQDEDSVLWAALPHEPVEAILALGLTFLGTRPTSCICLVLAEVS